MSKKRSARIAVSAMGEAGHFQRLRPLVTHLRRRGVEVYVFTDERFAGEVARAGARFVDLFAGRPLAAADSAAQPFPCRFVSFAGVYADHVCREAQMLRPSDASL